MCGGSKAIAKKYTDDLVKKDVQYDRKYVSVEGVKNSDRVNGKEYYLSWFTDGGWEPDKAIVTSYEFKKDAKIASGKQVVDTLLEEIGSRKVSEILKSDKTIKSLTLDYTRDQELFNRVNKRFIEKGYDGIEDINDTDTDMPIIMFKSSEILGKPKTIQTGREAIEEIIKKQNT